MTAMTEIRTTEDRLGLMARTAEEMLQLSYEALKHEQIDLGEMSEKLGNVIQNEQREIVESVLERAPRFPDKTPLFRRYLSIVSHLERVGDYTVGILHDIRDKMEQRIDFSPDAMREIKFMFESLLHMLRCAQDAIEQPDPILSRYISDTAVTLDLSAEQSARNHEDRLLSGDCDPKAAPIYYDLLDSLKEIARHMRLMAERLNP